MALPDVQRSFHLSDAALGLVLAVAVGAAGFAGAIVGRLARHLRSLRLLAGLLIVWAICAWPPEFTHSTALFAATFGAAQIAAGCVDAAMNAPATVHFSGRSGALVRFHAIFNVGALLGAVASSLALAAGLSWRVLWPAVATVTVLVAALSLRGPAGEILDADHVAHSPTLAPLGESAPTHVAIDRSLRRDGLLAFLFVFALAEITEGGAFTWGVLYLRHHLKAGILVGAGAYVIGHCIAALARSLGGGVLKRTPVARAFVVGSAICAAGLVLEVATNSPFVAALGLTGATAGTSFFWPLVMSTIAERSSAPGRAVGTFTAAGYVGWVAGAPLIGFASDRLGARAGLLVMAAICLIVIGAVLVGVVPEPRAKSVTPVG
jgi:predicted MFS family arabinose efflux permease